MSLRNMEIQSYSGGAVPRNEDVEFEKRMPKGSKLRSESSGVILGERLSQEMGFKKLKTKRVKPDYLLSNSHFESVRPSEPSILSM
jgi:hypothetical protein